MLFSQLTSGLKALWVTLILLGHQGVKQRGVVLGEVLLLDSVLQTQKLTWAQRNSLYLPLALKKQKKKENIETPI